MPPIGSRCWSSSNSTGRRSCRRRWFSSRVRGGRRRRGFLGRWPTRGRSRRIWRSRRPNWSSIRLRGQSRRLKSRGRRRGTRRGRRGRRRSWLRSRSRRRRKSRSIRRRNSKLRSY